MTRLTSRILFAAAMLSIGCDNIASATTSAEKAKSKNEPQASTQKIVDTSYSGLLLPFMQDGKYGFIDIKGNFVIPPIFTSVSYFSEGMAAVYVGGHSFLQGVDNSAIGGRNEQYLSIENGKWGYIDRKGTMVIPPQFGSASEFSEGLAVVTLAKDPDSRSLDERQPTGYIGTDGLFKIPPKYEYSSPFKNGLAHVKLAKIEEVKLLDDGRYVDSSGKPVDLIAVMGILAEESNLIKGHWIDTTGKTIDDTTALNILKINRKVFSQMNTITIYGRPYEVEQYGLKDTNDRVVVNATYDDIWDFYNDRDGKAYTFTRACLASTWEIFGAVLAMVKTQRCGVIDRDGKVVAPLDFDNIQPWPMSEEELVVFTVGCKPIGAGVCQPDTGRKGIFSIKEQRIIVNPLFESIGVLRDGLIPVSVDGKWGYIDARGKYVILPQFRSAGPFFNGLASVGMAGYIDKAGKYVYRGSLGALHLEPKNTPASPPKASAVQSARDKKVETTMISGTGFVVNRQGHVLTNHHVVRGCTTIRAAIDGLKKPATVIASDAKNDLAVIKLPTPSLNVARFREGRNIKAGDGVVAVGFPLHGLLASEANVATGTVSALAGIGNDTRFLQISAPVQPGNSGGPLLDQSGNIVGIIVGKLDAIKIAKVTGDLPQNINFAINGAVAKSFLDANSVEYELASSGKKLESAEVGEQAKKFTLLLECLK